MIANRDDMRDLLAAYAVDSVSPQERAKVEAALAEDHQLRIELDEHRTVLSVLAEAVDPYPSTPSPLVWDRIASEIEGANEVSPKLVSVRDIQKQKRFTKWTATMAFAAMALALLLGVSVFQLQQERGTPALETAIQELLDDPSATVATLEAAGDVAAEARIVLGTDGVGYVYADSLPALDASRTYQLWAIVGDRVISAGVLGADPDDSPFQIVGDVAGFAITEEVAGGVPVSEGETIAVWLRNA
jgi:anti-sigma-K factor RskA